MLSRPTGPPQLTRVTDRVVTPRPPVHATAGPARAGRHRDGTAAFDDLFDHLPTGMLLAECGGDRPGRLVRVNAALCRITGYSRRRLLTMTLTDLVHPAQLASHRRRLSEVTSGRRIHSAVQRRWLVTDGREIWVQFNVSTVEDVTGEKHLVGMVDDITERVHRAQGISDQRWQDARTGLPTRELFTDRAAHALRAARRSGHPVAVLQIELDDLERCVDVVGPAATGELLTSAARRVAENIRPGDTVAASGPTGLLVLCPEFAPADLTSTDPHDRLDDLVERLREVLLAPYEVGGVVHHLPPRIGRTTSVAGQQVRELLDALRRSVPTRPVLRGPQDERRSAPALLGRVAAARHIRLESELRHALTHDEVVMFGQPVVSMASGRIEAVEMLVRWRHPVRGMLNPADFLDVAEASPLMEPLGRRVLRESCRIAAGWRVPLGDPLPSVFVNVSGRQLESGRLSREVFAALRESGLAPHRLVLELTETCAPIIDLTVLADLALLRRHGIRLAVDDLGTGYSTLARLTELPIDLLKIDRAFVVGLGHPGSADAIVRAIMGISRSLGVPVVAEGIETPDQADAVARHGCHAGQGFLFSRPCPERELTDRLMQPGRPPAPSPGD